MIASLPITAPDELTSFDPVLFGLGLILTTAIVLAMKPWRKADEWRAAPVELLAFMWFSLAVCVADFCLGAFFAGVRDSLNPYAGRLPVFVYMLGAFGGMQLCRDRRRGQLWILVGFLAFWCTLTLARFEFGRHRFDDPDPYWRVSRYQPIWTVGVPLLWAVVLLSPRVRRYCTRTSPRAVSTPRG